MKKFLIKFLVANILVFIAMIVTLVYNNEKVNLYVNDIYKILISILFIPDLFRWNGDTPSVNGTPTKSIQIDRWPNRLVINGDEVRIPFWTKIVTHVIDDEVFVDMYQYNFKSKKLKITLRSMFRYLI